MLAWCLDPGLDNFFFPLDFQTQIMILLLVTLRGQTELSFIDWPTSRVIETDMEMCFVFLSALHFINV